MGVLQRKLKVLEQLLCNCRGLKVELGLIRYLTEGPVSDTVSQSWSESPDQAANQFCIALHHMFSCSPGAQLASRARTCECGQILLPHPVCPVLSRPSSAGASSQLCSGEGRLSLSSARCLCQCELQKARWSQGLFAQVALVWDGFLELTVASKACEGLVVLSLLHASCCFRVLWAAGANSSFPWAAVLTNLQAVSYNEKPEQGEVHL